MPYEYKPFSYAPPPGLSRKEPQHKVIIVGAGPVGLAMALDLANHGVPSVVLDDNDVVSIGSRAICWSKRSLEIFDRLGIGDKALAKGVTWQVGRTFHRDKEVFHFDLLPETGHKMPAFVNLQQYYVEEYLAAQAAESDLIDLRFRNRLVAVEQTDAAVHIRVETPDGEYGIQADYLLACDGARSPVRSLMKLDFEGELFEERFLIADIEMEGDFPSERHFWFEPAFHDGQSALLHKQPDNIYRIDLQLGPDADPVAEKTPANVIPRIERMVGHREFRLDWVSVYTFHCRRLREFIHGRVIFTGDSAHVVSPFGARGGNSGMQDVDNLGWKLAAVLQGRAGQPLLDSYNSERVLAADENLRNSTRATRFMAPADGVERLFRDQVLWLAARAPFARAWVNSGRLITPCVYASPGPDDSRLPKATRPGVVAQDAPQGNGWLMNLLGGDVKLMAINCDAPRLDLPVVNIELNDEVRARYLGEAGQALYLVRPDQVIAGRWVAPQQSAVAATRDAIWEGRS